MDTPDIRTFALAAGLEKAWDLFPAEMLAAASLVEAQRASLGKWRDPDLARYRPASA